MVYILCGYVSIVLMYSEEPEAAIMTLTVVDGGNEYGVGYK